MLTRLERAFGKDFWPHVIIGISHTGYEDEDRVLEFFQEWKDQISEMFPKSRTAPLEAVVLDAKGGNNAQFSMSVRKLLIYLEF